MNGTLRNGAGLQSYIWCDTAENGIANTFDVLEIVEPLEWSMSLSVVDDALWIQRTDPGKSCEFIRACLINGYAHGRFFDEQGILPLQALSLHVTGYGDNDQNGYYHA